jgi:hypothetical protein
MPNKQMIENELRMPGPGFSHLPFVVCRLLPAFCLVFGAWDLGFAAAGLVLGISQGLR